MRHNGERIRDERIFSRALRTHQWICEHTDGLLGHRLPFGNPTLLLRTTGRRTGLPRTNALTDARDGDAFLVVASNGGLPKPSSSPRNPTHAQRPLTVSYQAANT